jgi:hypothetical protein
MGHLPLPLPLPKNWGSFLARETKKAKSAEGRVDFPFPSPQPPSDLLRQSRSLSIYCHQFMTRKERFVLVTGPLREHTLEIGQIIRDGLMLPSRCESNLISHKQNKRRQAESYIVSGRETLCTISKELLCDK